jgi:hypothetical protein
MTGGGIGADGAGAGAGLVAGETGAGLAADGAGDATAGGWGAGWGGASRAATRALRSSSSAPSLDVRIHSRKRTMATKTTIGRYISPSTCGGSHGGQVQRELPDGAQIDLPCPQRRNRLDEVQIFALRQPESGQIRAAQPLPQLVG